MWRMLALAALAIPVACTWEPVTDVVEEAVAYYPICVDHFVCCKDTKLGDTYDEPGKSRCTICMARCHDEDDGRGHWPTYTHGGWDCQYWKPEFWYRRPASECEDLRR